MSKYIDADELKKRIREGWINGISTVINTMPAADVAPIIHAKWESRTVSVDKWRELWVTVLADGKIGYCAKEYLAKKQ